MLETCYFCHSDQLEERRVRVDFRWGEQLVVIDEVPSTVCLQCGEQYFDAAVSEAMEKLALAPSTGHHRILRVPIVPFAKAA